MLKIFMYLGFLTFILYAHESYDEMSYVEFRKGVVKEELYNIKEDYCKKQQEQEDWYEKVEDVNTSCK